MISNRTRAARSFDFEITRMISDQIALHSVQLLLFIVMTIMIIMIIMIIVIIMIIIIIMINQTKANVQYSVTY